MIKKYKRKHTAEQREKDRKRANAYYHKNQIKVEEKRKASMTEEKRLANAKRANVWYYKNKDIVKEYRQSEEYKRKKREADKVYSKNNRGTCNAIKTKYKEGKYCRTPKWLTKEHLQQIKEFYILSIEKTKKEGIEYQVDHIIPLHGKDVSGLHVPWNLQILTKEQNVKKLNKLLAENIIDTSIFKKYDIKEVE